MIDEHGREHESALDRVGQLDPSDHAGTAVEVDGRDAIGVSPDAAGVMARRALAVLAPIVVLGLSVGSWSRPDSLQGTGSGPIEWYVRSVDDTTVSIDALVAGRARTERTTVTETSSSVTIETIGSWPKGASCPDRLACHAASLTLGEPLGGRSLKGCDTPPSMGAIELRSALPDSSDCLVVEEGRSNHRSTIDSRAKLTSRISRGRGGRRPRS
jgi:hypothetical protein